MADNVNDPLYFTLNCLFCTKKDRVKIQKQDFDDYHNGKPIQQAFTHLTAEQREMFKSEICRSCWERFFVGKIFGCS